MNEHNTNTSLEAELRRLRDENARFRALLTMYGIAWEGATAAASASHSAPNFTTNPYFIAANRSTLSPTTLAARTNHNSIHQKVLDKIAAT
ncbi:MAG: hypothetical protein KJ558_00100, partial [Gammaproteobacteria bacterium]|nr:hypothetical protein [Gammaproteobacteria bacterium]MBU1962366.1 hypothetical protein [Gammaproteobacteria bacterium]